MGVRYQSRACQKNDEQEAVGVYVKILLEARKTENSLYLRIWKRRAHRERTKGPS